MITEYFFEYNKISQALNFKIQISSISDFEMAIYLFENDIKIDVSWYKKSHSYSFDLENIDIKNKKDYQLGVFIKDKDNISNFKTFKINPYKLTFSLNSYLDDFKNLTTANSIEKYIIQNICTSDFSFNDILSNFIYNEYNVDNIIFTDYIFSRYFIYRINIKEDWFNHSGSLGVINLGTLNKIIKKAENWYKQEKISDFTLNLVYGIQSIYFCDYHKAVKFFHSYEVPKEYYFPALINGLSTFREIDKKNDVSNFPYNITEQKIIMGDKLTIVFSCNRVYFNKFFEDALNSILVERNDFNVAIALINFKDEDIECFNSIIDSYIEKYNIDFSFINLETDKHEKTLSACARFIISDLMLRKTQSNTLVLDLDIFYTSQSNKMLNNIIKKESIGLSLKTNGVRLLPWTAVAAAASYFPNNNTSRIVTNAITDYINFSYNDNYNWYLDQNALFYAFVLMKKFFPLLSISNIHSFASTLLTKNNDEKLFQWKRELIRKSELYN